MTLALSDVPVVPRGVRLHFDRVRDRWVLLAPERTVALDPVSHAILSEIDGKRDFGAIVSALAAKYAAPADQIAQDAGEYLAGLIDRRMMERAR